MKKLFACLIAAAIITPCAQAQETSPYYAGLTVSKSGQTRAFDRTGTLVSADGRVGVKAFAGYNFTPSLALEAGYADYGSHVLKNTGPGISGDATVDTSLFYLAGKGTYMFGERFGAFAKLGVAHTRFDQDGLGAPDVTMTRPMFGVGLQYKISEQVALTLEVDSYGTKRIAPNKYYSMRKLEAGLKFSF